MPTSHCVMRRVQKTQVCPANCALHVLANVCPPQAEDIRSRCPHIFPHYSQFRHLCAASILTAVQGREGRSRTSDTVSSPSWPLQGCAYTCQVLVVRGVSLPRLRAAATSRHEPSEEEWKDGLRFFKLPLFSSPIFPFFWLSGSCTLFLCSMFPLHISTNIQVALITLICLDPRFEYQGILYYPKLFSFEPVDGL